MEAGWGNSKEMYSSGHSGSDDVGDGFRNGSGIS